MPKTKAVKRRPATTAARRTSAAKATGRKSGQRDPRRKTVTSNRRRASSGTSLEKFNSDLAHEAGKLHDKLVAVGPAITFKNAEPPEYYLAEMVKLGVLSETEADELEELADEVQKNSATANARVEELAVLIVKNGKRGPMARALAGIAIASAKKATTTKLFSVAGADFWGAAIGGGVGALAGGMMTKTTGGAIAGGVAGAIIVGGLASAHEAGHI